MGASEYVNHLYSKDLEGYIQILQLHNGQVMKLINTDVEGIVDVVQAQEGQEDTFISPNSFYIPNRANTNIRHFRALYIDLDLDQYSKSEAFYQVYMKSAKGEIPKPSMIIDSGRGLHLYWRIEHAPKGALYTWQELQDYLYYHLKYLGADIKATDSSRVLRLPNTINSKNGATCIVLEMNDFKYSMYELREQYLNYIKKDKPKNQVIIKEDPKVKVKHLFNSYSLHIARSSDLRTIARLRNYDLKGYRNSILHCYCYWQGVTTRDTTRLLDETLDFNNQFLDPLKDSEVKAIVKSTSKAVEKFIEYEQGIRSGENKRVSKPMKERGGYWYTNKRLIEMLNITGQEQEHLKTIIGTDEKYRRKNLKRRQERRNEEGLTSREQQKRDTVSKVKELNKKGLNQVEISKELGITQGYVSRILNKK